MQAKYRVTITTKTNKVFKIVWHVPLSQLSKEHAGAVFLRAPHILVKESDKSGDTIVPMSAVDCLVFKLIKDSEMD